MAPRTRKTERIWLVRVGERTYFSDETEKIMRQRLVLDRQEAWRRREAALRLWFKVGLDIEASLRRVSGSAGRSPVVKK
jgi:hypothetical protein